jgi:hypothetical protein
MTYDERPMTTDEIADNKGIRHSSLAFRLLDDGIAFQILG